MVPRVGGKGNSFHGAGMYYLHDKREEGQEHSFSDERVEYIDTHNLPTKDAWQALHHMSDTAQNHAKLKELAGIQVRQSANGDPKSVYTYSLGWRAGDEHVSNDDMRKAGISSLEAIGLGKHQALFVRHGDTDHQHIHVIANLIDPENGKVNSVSRDHIKLSKWAEKYELEHGGIQCEQRAQNNAQRDKEFVKYEPSHTRDEWLAEKERRSQFWDGVRSDRQSFSQTMLDQRTALFEAKEEQIAKARQLIKDAYKPKWAEMFSEHREELAELADQTDSVMGRVARILTNRKEALGEQAGLKDYFNAVFDKDVMKSAVETRHTAEKDDLSTQQGNDTRDQMKLVNKGYKVDRMALLEQQQEQKTTFNSQMDERVSEFRDISYGTDATLSNDDGMERDRENTIDPPKNTPD